MNKKWKNLPTDKALKKWRFNYWRDKFRWRIKNKHKKNNLLPKEQKFISKITVAFMLPIAILPLAGLFLGIGSLISTQTSGGSKQFGLILNSIGQIVFTNLPLFFAVGVAAGFSGKSAVAVLSAVLGYLVFNVFQSQFLQANYSQDKIINYQLWFWKNIEPSSVISMLGLTTLNTGIIGGLLVGTIAAFCYNRFHQVKLNSLFSFFAKDHFVAVVMIFGSIALSALFMLVWPGISYLLGQFGLVTTKMPFGLDSLVEGVVAKSLIPFGVHVAFYGTMWWSPAGGSLIDFQQQIVNNHLITLMENSTLTISDQAAIVEQLKNLDQSLTNDDLLAAIKSILGTHNVSLYNELASWFNSINPETWNVSGDQLMQQAIYADPTLKIQEVREAGLHLGRFISGGYTLNMFVSPLVGLAMISTIKKERRKLVYGIYLSGIATTFLTGVTEPIEYTILFASPFLYYLVYVPIAGLAWMFTNIAGVSIATSSLQGFIDFILYGILPLTNGHNTNFWMTPIIGISLGIGAFFAFRYLILAKNLPIPGRVIEKPEIKIIKE